MSVINYIKKSDTVYDVVFGNGVNIGEIYQEIDGFFVFWPGENASNKGFWSSHIMRAIADKIDEMNKPYQEELDRFFDSIKKIKLIE